MSARVVPISKSLLLLGPGAEGAGNRPLFGTRVLTLSAGGRCGGGHVQALDLQIFPVADDAKGRIAVE
jgi:hypothetical protein